MEIVYGANIKDHINVIFQNFTNFNRGDLQLNLSKTVPVALIFCTVLYIRTNLKAMSVSVVGSH